MIYLLEIQNLDHNAKYRHQIHIRLYEAFCRQHRLPILPATLQSLQAYLEHVSQRVSWPTLQAYVREIRRYHEAHGWPDPFSSRLAQATLRVLERRCAERRAILLRHTQEIGALFDRIEASPLGLRDKAMLGVAYCTRASLEWLAAMERNHVQISASGMRVTIQRGQRRQTITVARYANPRYCPVAFMERYLRLLQDDEPTLFRRIRHRTEVTARKLSKSTAWQALAARLRDPSNPDDHRKLLSLHASAVIAASGRNASAYAIQRQMGYKRISSVRGIIERFGADRTDITDKLGL